MGRFFRALSPREQILLLLSTAFCVVFLAYLGINMSTRSSYEIIQPGHMSRDLHLLDKKTGRLWQRACRGQNTGFECNGVLYWDEMYVANMTPQSSSPAKVYDLVRQMQAQANVNVGISADAGNDGTWYPREKRHR